MPLYTNNKVLAIIFPDIHLRLKFIADLFFASGELRKILIGVEMVFLHFYELFDIHLDILTFFRRVISIKFAVSFLP